MRQMDRQIDRSEMRRDELRRVVDELWLLARDKLDESDKAWIKGFLGHQPETVAKTRVVRIERLHREFVRRVGG